MESQSEHCHYRDIFQTNQPFKPQNKKDSTAKATLSFLKISTPQNFLSIPVLQNSLPQIYTSQSNHKRYFP